jgi:hypothetical protein
MSMKKVLDVLTYDGFSIVDLEEDVKFLLDQMNVEIDEHGLFKGKIRVTIEYSDE